MVVAATRLSPAGLVDRCLSLIGTIRHSGLRAQRLFTLMSVFHFELEWLSVTRNHSRRLRARILIDRLYNTRGLTNIFAPGSRTSDISTRPASLNAVTHTRQVSSKARKNTKSNRKSQHRQANEKRAVRAHEPITRPPIQIPS